MRRINRRDLVLGLGAAAISLPAVSAAPRASAQGAIPDGVFVRESNGTVWLVIGGQRVAVPIWQAGDADIAALPKSDLWAVMNDGGAVSGGSRPAWFTDVIATAPATAAAPAAVPSAPTTDGLLTITEYTTYKVPVAQGTYVVGVIENQGGAATGVKTIAVSLLGAAGETVGGASAIYKPFTLPAGAKSGWLALVSNAPEFTGVRVQVESGPAQQSFVPPITHELRLDGVTTQERRPAALPKIAGQVVNTGSSTVDRPQIIAAVFSGGKLIDVGNAYAKLETLDAGQSSPFEITFTSAGVTDPSSFHLFTEARVKR
jgi:hypothetical protein